MKFEKKYIQKRFIIIFGGILIGCAFILGKAIKTATFERDKWLKVGAMSVSDTMDMKPNRGNIFSSDGQLMASSLPDYKAYIDFLSGVEKKDSTDSQGKKIRIWNEKQLADKDSIWLANMDTICKGLAQICEKYTEEQYKEHLMQGLKERKRYWEICPRTTLNYIQFNKILKLPLFCLKPRYKSGLTYEERNNRQKPFGSLAKRTLGEMYGALDSARSGLELAYDSLLRGVPGKVHHKKVFNKYLDIIDKEPIDGYNLVTTIDVTMQDICESALREKLKELDATMGVVILMEVKTGNIKAIVNLERYDDGEYYEARNYALASLMEPGSTFKTASIMVGIDDGYIKVSDWVDTGGGVCPMYGSLMKDHNWATRGGYGVIDVPHILMYSSNVGVSKLIDKYYKNQPEKFVQGLRRVGIGTPLGLPFRGAAEPVIRMPNDTTHHRYWSKTTLPWMSIGYETQIPPISTVSFYNAIANGGKMVRPRFVKGIEKDGQMVEEFPVEVIKNHICKASTLVDIQNILKRVVNDKEGLGKKAGNPYFHVSGKTGTAQVSYRKGSGAKEHLVSFCGYYPSEDPKYSCIVAIRHSYYVASGGGQAGTVFSKIAQRVYSKNVTTDLRLAQDSTSVFTPNVKAGDQNASEVVLKQLGIRNSIREEQPAQYSVQLVPDVTGLGARDAVHELSLRGLKVRTQGRGVVKEQSIPAGTHHSKGQTITIRLN